MDGSRPAGGAALPLDLFIVTVREPAQIMAEYARLTGLPEMPPLWSLGYQQSHRTLASRDERALDRANVPRKEAAVRRRSSTSGTGFCPSGWNTGHGSFTFNPSCSPIRRRCSTNCTRCTSTSCLTSSSGAVDERKCPRSIPDAWKSGRRREAASYWDAHREVFALGVDGWWPDEGDPLDVPSRAGTDPDVLGGSAGSTGPIERPYALHRNGYAGMQRYGCVPLVGRRLFDLGDLQTHVPIAINTGLTGIPYWGTDIGGFVPTKELTGELYVRWFQFGAFCPLFRSHGRTWKLRLPWGWNTGELGPNEIRTYGDAANPDPTELHNAAVEPICRKYLELRYRLLPYLYSVVREGCSDGPADHPRSLAAISRTIRLPALGAMSISGVRTSWSRP